MRSAEMLYDEELADETTAGRARSRSRAHRRRTTRSRYGRRRRRAGSARRWRGPPIVQIPYINKRRR